MSPSAKPVEPSAGGFAAPPDPGQAGTLDDLADRLRLLKLWAGNPSYERITDQINTAWRAAGRPAGELARKNTVADCFKPGRRRFNSDLLIAVVQVLHPDVGYVTQWRQALRVVSGETLASAQIRVQDTLPQDLAVFTGRSRELAQLRLALLEARRDGGAVVISAIEGMAGVGKTQLAVHAGHLLTREELFDRVLFVNLRGFHPDPAQPPADPAAVLDGFLRLLGVAGQQIPHDLAARVATYLDRLAGARTLVVLDNAADAAQVRPLLAAAPGCLTLVTSRRSLADLQPATCITVDVFTSEEAAEFLTRAVPEVPAGSDPNAAARIAQRCGHLPLALGLVAGYIRGTSGWTLTDHADRLDERHHLGRLDTGVQLALNVSYQHLPADRQRLLRLLALHPGQDFDAYAAAALTDTDLAASRERLRHLCGDHLLQQAAAGRYSFHDLVRAYAADRAVDEDRPADRREALTRLFDFYLTTAAVAMEVAYPYEQHLGPMVAPAGISAPDLSEGNRADCWLDAELANLLAAGEHAAAHGWPEHTWRLSTILNRHLRTRSRHREAETLHQHALDLARRLGNQPAEMNALNGLGYIDRMLDRRERARDHHGHALRIAQSIGDRLGEMHALNGLGHVHRILRGYEQAGEYFGQALRIAQAVGDRVGERIALIGLGDLHWMLGRHEQASDHHGRALRIAQAVGDRVGELQALEGLGDVEWMLGRYQQAGYHYERALQIAQAVGDRVGELHALNGLGHVHRMLDQRDQAGDHHGQALRIAQAIGDRVGELNALTGLGHVYRMVGRYGEAADCYRQVLDLARKVGNSNWQFEALQGFGRLHHATGEHELALTCHRQALRIGTDFAQPPDQARAHDGLAHAHHALQEHDLARQHWQQALDILTGLATEHTEEILVSVPSIRARLSGLDRQRPKIAGGQESHADRPAR